ncbi:MAG TPA: tRNA glutamyl-Q synthetase [Bacteroidetes bacterium]|nr:tRNA glutamyl-Q synthetase [Bacteroidota bacterium]
MFNLSSEGFSGTTLRENPPGESPTVSSAVVRTRIAPTPSGLLHVGTAVNFYLTWLFGRLNDGEVLLRIDDADPNMRQQEYVDDIRESIKWLGLEVDQALPYQSSRRDRYLEALNELRQSGTVFACSCSRSVVRRASPDNVYPGTCRSAGLSLDEPSLTWRADVSGLLPFPVVRQKSGVASYHIASLCDDVDFAISHVIRGADLFAATDAQRRLASLAPSLAPFLTTSVLFHPLVYDANGVKLSKSLGAASLSEMRLRGEGPDSILQLLAAMLGIQRTVSTIHEVLNALRVNDGSLNVLSSRDPTLV